MWRRTRGAGVTIAVVDTGIDGADPDLKGVEIESRDLLGGRAPHISADSHGTEVAELIAGNGTAGPRGLAPGASLIDIRVAATPAAVTATAIAAGINAAVKTNAQVINVSLGVDEDTATLRAAIRTAERDGRLVVSSAGGTATRLYPADIAGVLSVGATDQHGRRAAAPSSTVLYAPGIDVITNTGTGGSAATSALGGSDFAAAYVSAAAALLLSPGLSGVRRLTPLDAGRDLVAAGGASRLLDPDSALQRAQASPAPKTSTPAAPKRTPTPRPAPGGTSVLTYVVAAVAAVIVLFAGWLVFLAIRTRRTEAGESQTDPVIAPALTGRGRIALPADHEAFSWDQSW
jgi:subtilisin family serine protease